MRPAINDLMRAIVIEGDDGDYSFMQLSMLLEASTKYIHGKEEWASITDNYREIQTPELIEIIVSIDEQREIVDKLVQLISANQSAHQMAAALFALSKCHPDAGWHALLSICNVVDKYGTQCIEQALVAVQNYLAYGIMRLSQMDYRKLFAFISKCHSSNDAGVREFANNLLRHIAQNDKTESQQSDDM